METFWITLQKAASCMSQFGIALAALSLLFIVGCEDSKEDQAVSQQAQPANQAAQTPQPQVPEQVSELHVSWFRGNIEDLLVNYKFEFDAEGRLKMNLPGCPYGKRFGQPLEYRGLGRWEIVQLNGRSPGDVRWLNELSDAFDQRLKKLAEEEIPQILNRQAQVKSN